MYFYRIADSLKEDFPSLEKLLGEEPFYQLIRSYLSRYPSVHWSLRDAGKSLPHFLQGHAVQRRWPFLAELARFEWELLDLFDVADAVPLSKDRLAAIPAEQWESIPLSLVPGCRLFQSPWPLDQIRQAIVRNQTNKHWQRCTTYLQIWRQDFKVYYATLQAMEYQLLRTVLRGTNFGQVCERVAVQLGVEEAPLVAAQQLKCWLNQDILRGDV